MSDNRDEKLERMLRSRKVDAASSNLAQRIISRARNIPQKQTIPLLQWLKGLFAEFHLNRPGYVLGCTLILGFVIGINTPVDEPRNTSVSTTTEAADIANLQNPLYADEDIL
jgi:hypothetical protein